MQNDNNYFEKFYTPFFISGHYTAVFVTEVVKNIVKLFYFEPSTLAGDGFNCNPFESQFCPNNGRLEHGIVRRFKAV